MSAYEHHDNRRLSDYCETKKDIGGCKLGFKAPVSWPCGCIDKHGGEDVGRIVPSWDQ